jgi:hypothetical protein
VDIFSLSSPMNFQNKPTPTTSFINNLKHTISNFIKPILQTNTNSSGGNNRYSNDDTHDLNNTIELPVHNYNTNNHIIGNRNSSHIQLRRVNKVCAGSIFGESSFFLSKPHR